MYSQRKLEEDLKAIGVKAGDRIIVHSSFRSLGPVRGGIKTVLRGLMETITPKGTIMMPVFNAPQEAWDTESIPSSVGAITNVFRMQRDALRSIHPTHSVAVWGDKAELYADGHLQAGALSVGSPMHKLARDGGKVIGIGVDMRTCSLIHISESIARLPYLRFPYPGYEKKHPIQLEDGSTIEFTDTEYPGDSAAFNRVRDLMQGRGELALGQVLDAKTYFAEAGKILDASLEIIKKNPAGLLCDEERCAVCPARKKMLSDTSFGGGPGES